MRILVFISVLGILVSIGVLILVIIKANAGKPKAQDGKQTSDKA